VFRFNTLFIVLPKQQQASIGGKMFLNRLNLKEPLRGKIKLHIPNIV
jgi:hypothetical protein